MSFDQYSVQNVIQVECESDVSAASKRVCLVSFLVFSFSLVLFSHFLFSCQSQLFGVIDDQGNIPIVLRLFRNHFLILLCFVTFCVWCFCEMQFRVRETVQAPF